MTKKTLEKKQASTLPKATYIGIIMGESKEHLMQSGLSFPYFVVAPLRPLHTYTLISTHGLRGYQKRPLILVHLSALNAFLNISTHKFRLLLSTGVWFLHYSLRIIATMLQIVTNHLARVTIVKDVLIINFLNKFLTVLVIIVMSSSKEIFSLNSNINLHEHPSIRDMFSILCE